MTKSDGRYQMAHHIISADPFPKGFPGYDADTIEGIDVLVSREPTHYYDHQERKLVPLDDTKAYLRPRTRLEGPLYASLEELRASARAKGSGSKME